MRRIAILLGELGEQMAARLSGVRSFFAGAEEYRCEFLFHDDAEQLIDRAPDGLILLGPAGRFPLPEGVPAVSVGGEKNGNVTSIIREDDRAVGRLAAELFVRSGVLEGMLISTDELDDGDLWNGFSSALSLGGIASQCLRVARGSAERIASLTSRRSGILLATDLLAVRYFDQIERRRDHLWISRGDFPKLSVSLGLTCSVEASARLGFLAALFLIKKINGEEPPALLEVAPLRMVARESTYRFAGCRNETVRDSLAFIRKNLSSPIGIDEVAATVGVSRSVLLRRFRDELDLSVLNVIQWHRVEEVKERLFHGAPNYEVMAEATGFSSAAHMAEIFKKWTGFTPKNYLDQVRQSDQ